MAQSDDAEAIRRIEQMWDAAWNRHDAKALAALLSEDVDFVNVTGAWFKGRSEFEERMRQTHEGAFKNRWRLESSCMRLTHALLELGATLNHAPVTFTKSTSSDRSAASALASCQFHAASRVCSMRRMASASSD